VTGALQAAGNPARPQLEGYGQIRERGTGKIVLAMVGRLYGKVALVVGAGSVGPGWGNGKAAAVLFAREGAKVLCADVNEDAANETIQIIRQESGTANAICADVTSHDDIRRMVKACTQILWTDRCRRLPRRPRPCRRRRGIT
jgi:hypothetical protein